MLAPKKIVGPKKMWVKKNVGSKNGFGSKRNFWSKNKFGSKINVVSKKMLCPKKFWLQKKCGSKKMLGPKMVLALKERGVYLRDCDAILALFFLFFIRMTSFWNIMGGMGPSLCIPSFVKIRQLLPPKFLILPPFFLAGILVSSLEYSKKDL